MKYLLKHKIKRSLKFKMLNKENNKNFKFLIKKFKGKN